MASQIPLRQEMVLSSARKSAGSMSNAELQWRGSQPCDRPQTIWLGIATES